MSEPDGTSAPRDQLLEEAAAWFARMRGPDAEASRDEFEAWLRRGALHRAAYNRASEIFSMGKFLSEDESADAAPACRRNAQERRRRWTAIAAAILVFAAGLVALRLLGAGAPSDNVAQGGQGSPAAQDIIATAPGERRTVQLEDGSIVALEGGTALSVEIGPIERRLRLARGRTLVRVFHDARPFVVDVGGGLVVARGTVFEVALGENRQVMVRLISGAVDVTLPASQDGRASSGTRRLAPGEHISYQADGPAPAPTTSATPTETGVQAAGAFGDYQDIDVRTLVGAANRLSPRPIRLADPTIGRQRVSGRFRVDDTRVLADRLALLFDLAVELRDEEIVLRPR